jgi:hypothetical protein
VTDIDIIEQQRLQIQAELDAQKTQGARNKLGQFATPTALARDILRYAGNLLPVDKPIRFLDPAIGTGSFFSALRAEYPTERIDSALGYDIDPHYAGPAMDLWRNWGLDYHLQDFTTAVPDQHANVLICNPPYVRHHHLSADDKARLQRATLEAIGAKFGGLSGLYCYFMALAHPWMAAGGVAGWLIPSEFMNVNYGRPVKQYLLDKVTLLHIHRFDPSDVQFADALVSSAIVWFKNTPPPADHQVRFTYGGTLEAPHQERLVPLATLAREEKWIRFPAAADDGPRNSGPVLSDFFKIRRGLATGNNSFFILSEEELTRRDLPIEAFRPILPSPRHVAQDVIEADSVGIPTNVARLFLLDPRLPESEIAKRYPSLSRYLDEGRAQGFHETYLCRNRTRWYDQENRVPAPIVCTYLGRADAKSGRPFRFIRNRSNATIANVFLAMYPTPAFERALKLKPELLDAAWRILNEIPADKLLGESRVYGGGLHKLEPKELANVPVPALAELLPNDMEADYQFEMLQAAE